MVPMLSDRNGPGQYAVGFQAIAPVMVRGTKHHAFVCRTPVGRNLFVARGRSARVPDVASDARQVGRTCWKASASATETDWSGLDVRQFDALLEGGQLPLCLVGMSNCGKSHWSRRLKEERGFRVQCVDDEIEQALKPELAAGGHHGIDGLAAWMGFPTDARFAAAQEKYLAAEDAVTSTVRGVDGGTDGNCVLDTTGSVVYLGEQALQRLRERFFIVHLVAGDEMLERMTKRFFESPKPVVWGDAFDREDGEGAEQAIRRCYPRLLRERRVRYEEVAHVSVQASACLSKEMDVDGFLQLVRAELP